MNYNGQKLEPITDPQIFDPPREMLVWDVDDDKPKIRDVWCIAPPSACQVFPVMTTESSYKHCAEIPEQKRATNRELSEWVAKGNGLVLIGELISNHYDFLLQEEDELAEGVQIQPFNNSSTEWLEPTLENMGLEE